jgi:tripartite-type tricarboxylate transporter receptor subunit TctC
MNTTRFGTRILAALAVLLATAPALGQTHSTGSGQAYPRGSVRVILPFPAGGGVDAAGRILNVMAGVQMVHVPYRGSGPAMIGLLAGDAPVMFLPAINAGPHVASGRLRAIAVTSRERLAAMPEVPTVSEAGLNGYESSQWYGLLAPAGTPPEVLNLLNAQVARIMQSAEMKITMTNDGLVPIGSSREQFAAHIRSEIDKWARVISASGARVD